MRRRIRRKREGEKFWKAGNAGREGGCRRKGRRKGRKIECEMRKVKEGRRREEKEGGGRERGVRGRRARGRGKVEIGSKMWKR